ncbi:MAG: hypothetical protein HZY75_13225 [Nocardioidaceae bacterium]|nr:MAG: hypothetical protein HZY75_13225 [Nocardioidaceae bacterium]
MTDPTQLTEAEREALKAACGWMRNTNVEAVAARIKADAIADTKRALLADSRTRVEWEVRILVDQGSHECTYTELLEADATRIAQVCGGTLWRREVTSIYGEWEQVEI